MDDFFTKSVRNRVLLGENNQSNGRESLNTSLTDSRELFLFSPPPPWRQRAGHGQTVNWGRDLDSLNLLTCAARWMVCDSPCSSYTKHRLIIKGQDLNIALGLFAFSTHRNTFGFHLFDTNLPQWSFSFVCELSRIGLAFQHRIYIVLLKLSVHFKNMIMMIMIISIIMITVSYFSAKCHYQVLIFLELSSLNERFHCAL